MQLLQSSHHLTTTHGPMWPTLTQGAHSVWFPKDTGRDSDCGCHLPIPPTSLTLADMAHGTPGPTLISPPGQHITQRLALHYIGLTGRGSCFYGGGFTIEGSSSRRRITGVRATWSSVLLGARKWKRKKKKMAHGMHTLPGTPTKCGPRTTQRATPMQPPHQNDVWLHQWAG